MSRAKQGSAIGALGSRGAGACCTQRILKTSNLDHSAVAHCFSANYITHALATIPGMANLTLAIKALEQERNRLTSQLEALTNALSALSVKGSPRRAGISAAGRARIAAAQRVRWARGKGEKVVSISAHKRNLSPAARRRMASRAVRRPNRLNQFFSQHMLTHPDFCFPRALPPVSPNYVTEVTFLCRNASLGTLPRASEWRAIRSLQRLRRSCHDYSFPLQSSDFSPVCELIRVLAFLQIQSTLSVSPAVVTWQFRTSISP